jgi:LysM repeat protein
MPPPSEPGLEAQHALYALRTMLLASFSADELRRFVREHYRDVEHALPGSGASADIFAAETVLALERRRLVDERLFRKLQRERPSRRREILECARAWDVPESAVPEDPAARSPAIEPDEPDPPRKSRARFFSLDLNIRGLRIIVMLSVVLAAVPLILYTLKPHDSPLAYPIDPVEVVKKIRPPSLAPKEEWIEHVVSPGDTYEVIARYYGVSPAQVKSWNDGRPELEAGSRVKVRTSQQPRPPLAEERYIAVEGDDWRTIASIYGTSVERLVMFNPEIGERPRPGDELRLWIEAGQFGERTPNPDDLPIFVVPQGATSVGKSHESGLRDPVQLLPSEVASVRCAAHAYATGHTVAALLRGIAEFRAEGYTGELMIAELSALDGGYGPHRSHQTGRDVDIWLLPKGGRYRRGCPNCSTDACRPGPDEVDWRATWRLIRALHATGQVKEIFLSHWMQQGLYNAARGLGETQVVLLSLIQYPRPKGHPAVVMHVDGHVHHFHVRFKCDPADEWCSDGA